MKLQAQIINVKKSGLCPVYVICYLDGERIRFKTGVDVFMNDFDQASGTVKRTCKDAKDKNLLINSVKKVITEIEIRYRLKHLELTPELLKAEYQRPNYNTSFISFYEFELQKRKGLLSFNMYEKYDVTLRKLKRFRPEITFSQLDIDFLNDFSIYCKKLGNCQNTINGNLKNIKFFVRLAYRKNLTNDDIFKEYKISTIRPMRNFLTENELKLIIGYFRKNILNDKHREILKTFLFACFTGLRFSDIQNLQFDHIFDDMLILKPQKTKFIDKTVKIPLCQPAKELIDYSKKTRKVFHVFSSQYVNRELKQIMDSVNIHKRITFHCARHTFATMYLRKTNDLAGLQKLLGHSNISETMIYAHSLDDDIKINIKTLDNIFV